MNAAPATTSASSTVAPTTIISSCCLRALSMPSWHFLNLRPLPHGHRSLRPVFSMVVLASRLYPRTCARTIQRGKIGPVRRWYNFCHGRSRVETGHSSRKLTYADYCAIPDDNLRHEIIDGRHYVSPSPRMQHQRV